MKTVLCKVLILWHYERLPRFVVTCCKETGNNQCKILNEFGTGCLDIKFYVQVHWVGYMQHGNKVPCIS